MADVAASPLARAIRFGREIRRLRERAGLTQDGLARQAQISRTVLSRIETPPGDPTHRPGAGHLRNALVALVGEGTEQYDALLPLLWDATRDDWWTHWRGMGRGQRLVAEVECGAARIREYQTELIPGLAQTADYARYRAEVTGAATTDVDAVVDGRMRRQQQTADAGTRYELILEEQALRRLAAPAEVMAEQLAHLLRLVEQPHISVRVLPIDARLPAGWSPTLPYSVYSYPDRRDPTIVLLDVVGQAPAPMAEPGETRLYVQLHERLSDAALSDVDSAACITDAVARWGGR